MVIACRSVRPVYSLFVCVCESALFSLFNHYCYYFCFYFISSTLNFFSLFIHVQNIQLDWLSIIVSTHTRTARARKRSQWTDMPTKKLNWYYDFFIECAHNIKWVLYGFHFISVNIFIFVCCIVILETYSVILSILPVLSLSLPLVSHSA